MGVAWWEVIGYHTLHIPISFSSQRYYMQVFLVLIPILYGVHSVVHVMFNIALLSISLIYYIKLDKKKFSTALVQTTTICICSG